VVGQRMFEYPAIGSMPVAFPGVCPGPWEKITRCGLSALPLSYMSNL
jgi:hypothetical protein